MHIRLKKILFIKNLYYKYLIKILKIIDRKRLKNRDFTIISDNCWGGQVYKDLGIKYNTPFVGLFIFSPDYLKLLENLEYYLNLDIKFLNYSKYGKFNYPVGVLEDIEIHFLHYSSVEEAKSKWNRRVKRINWDNILVKMNDADLCSIDLIRKFDLVPFKKVFFSAINLTDIDYLIYFKELENTGYIKDGKDMLIYRKYFDVVKWIDSNSL